MITFALEPRAPQLRLDVRPMGALSKSLTTAWQGRCEMMHVDLQGVLNAG